MDISDTSQERPHPVPTRLLGQKRYVPQISVSVDGQSVVAYEGESVAAVLMAAGQRTFAETSSYNLARTLFCGMGVCHQCLVKVDGTRGIRACMTKVEQGMQIETQAP